MARSLMSTACIGHALATILAVVALSGCVHSTRCDQRAASASPARYRTMLASVRRAYEQGMRDFNAPNPSRNMDRGKPKFHTNVFVLRNGPRDGGFAGGFLFEQLENGDWAYRCDEMTKVFALSAYRLGIILAEEGFTHMSRGFSGADPFCEALQARPDIVIPLAEKERLSPEARSVLEDALGDDACYFEHGFRSSSPPAGASILTQ